MGAIKWEPRPFPAKVLRVVDGDTLDLMIDCGFGVHTRQRVRLARIDTPEVRGEERPEGIKAKAFVEDFLHGISQVLVTTQKDKGKFGRYIGEIVVIREGEMINLSDRLLKEGLAEEYKG